MKVLFFTNPHEDYLADSLFHGFRKLYGADCVDFPKCEIMYKGCPLAVAGQVRGNGFTLYSGLLEDIVVDRFNIGEKIKTGYFDLIIFSNIQRQFGLFVQYRPWLKPSNTVVVDGEDTDFPFPARGFWWRRPYYWLLPKAHRQFLYFKREWTERTGFSLLKRVLPVSIVRRFAAARNLRTISFSFPAEKIINAFPEKRKPYPVHIVDTEVAGIISRATTSYAFSTEAAYYEDLQQSRFGISVKRAGWDSLRHYEIAANGGIVCFRNLDKKPVTCAPHGLTSKNTIIYTSAEDLFRQVEKVDDLRYSQLQQASLDWIRQHTTEKMAGRIIDELNSFNQ